MKWLLKQYMTKQHIESLMELSKRTGIGYQTLNNHIKNVGEFRAFELRQLDEILHFSDEDMLLIIRGGIKD